MGMNPTSTLKQQGLVLSKITTMNIQSQSFIRPHLEAVNHETNLQLSLVQPANREVKSFVEDRDMEKGLSAARFS